MHMHTLTQEIALNASPVSVAMSKSLLRCAAVARAPEAAHLRDSLAMGFLGRQEDAALSACMHVHWCRQEEKLLGILAMILVRFVARACRSKA